VKKGLKVGIDIGSKNLRILVTTLNENSPHPKILTGAVEPSDGIRNGRVVSHYDALKSLRKLLEKTERELGSKITSVNVSITGDFTKTKVVQTKNTVSKASNEVTELDFEKARQEAVNAEAVNSPYHILNVSLSEVKIDGKKVRGNAINSIGSIIETTQVLHLIPKKILEEFVKLFDDLEINVSELILGQLVSYIPVTKRSERIAGIGVLNIGHDTTTFTYFENELPVIMKQWSVGGANITNDIALILETKIDDAENIKKDFKNLNVKKVPAIINARLEDISDLIKKEILKINKLGKVPGGIVVIGGGSKIDGIEVSMKKSLGMQVTNGSKIISEITKNILKDATWSTVLGLTYIEESSEMYSSEFFKKFKDFVKKFFAKISP
jgi:cell division protein FtsA